MHFPTRDRRFDSQRDGGLDDTDWEEVVKEARCWESRNLLHNRKDIGRGFTRFLQRTDCYYVKSIIDS